MSEQQLHDTPSVEALPSEPHIEDDAEAQAAQSVFEYDADTLATLTADQMDVIENDAWTQIDAGQTPEQVQADLYQKLTDLGFDLSSVQHDQLVVRFAGVDGKEDIRAIKIDYRDFGTRVKAAELHAVTPDHLEADDGEPARETESDDEAQQQMLNSLKEHLRDEVNRLDVSSDDARHLREKIWHDVAGVRDRVRMITRQIDEGALLSPQALRQFEDGIMNDTVRTLAGYADKTDQDRVLVSRLEDTFAEVHHGATRKLDGSHADTLQATVQKANSIRVELGANRTQEDAAAHRAGTICARIGQVISEMSTSRYGYASFNSQLRQLSSELEAEIARHGASESQLRRLSTALRGALEG